MGVLVRLRFVALAVLAVVAIGVSFAALTRSIPESVASYTPPPATLSSPKAAVPVSLISDSHAHNAKSWWRESIGAKKVAGAISGDVQSFPGADSESITRQLKATNYSGGLVVIQAGTNDLRAGDDARTTASGVESLVGLVRERNGKPILALIPPSDEAPGVAKEANSLLIAWAGSQKIHIVDVYTPVAAPDGSWLPGMSDDTIHANSVGSARMADEAKVRFAAILAG